MGCIPSVETRLPHVGRLSSSTITAPTLWFDRYALNCSVAFGTNVWRENASTIGHFATSDGQAPGPCAMSKYICVCACQSIDSLRGQNGKMKTVSPLARYFW